jgi:hypothetical protein
MITCIGQMSIEEHLDWDISNKDLLEIPPLADEEVVGAIRYDEVIKVTAGLTEFVKDLGVDTRDVRNLDVAKSIGYAAGATIGTLAMDEEVSMSIVANSVATKDVILCPFASAAVETLPASCEDVSAGSSVVVTEVKLNTRTKVGITEAPVALSYGVDATGLGGSGTYAVGRISAHMSAFVEDGSDNAEMGGCVGDGQCAGQYQNVCSDYATEHGCNACDANAQEGSCDWLLAENPLGSRLSFSEVSTANGLFEFHQTMEYESVIRP